MTALPAADVVRPRTLAEAHEAMRGDGPLLVRGAGTKQSWGGRVDRIDRVIDTTALRGILAHDAGDQTATVQPGLPLAALQQELAAHGQWLALDPPSAGAGATVGGVLATGEHGPRRLRYGAPRDLVIGMTVVLGDGAVARSGGNVIKNVAGYDLGRLFCGSLGTLGLVAEVTVRLHPLPPASATVRVDAASAGDAATLTAALARSPLEPSAVDWWDGVLWVRLDGRDAGVEVRARAATEMAGDHRLDAVVLRGGDADRAWEAIATALHGDAEGTVLRAATLPDGLAAADRSLAEAVRQAIGEAGADGVSARLHSHAAMGLHTAVLAGGDPGTHLAVLRAWRQAIRRLGGQVELRRRPASMDALLDPATDVWGPPPAAAGLMGAVRARLDPGGRCAPGRMPWR